MRKKNLLKKKKKKGKKTNNFHLKERYYLSFQIIHLYLLFISNFFLTQNGYWADHVCEKKAGYICKRKGTSKIAGEKEITAAGCKKVSM